MSSLLGKTVSSLTDADKRALEKPLGILGRPFPMREAPTVTKDGKKLVLQQRLGVLEAKYREDALMVYSERPYNEVFGMAMREMPTPGMLKMFYDALHLRSPDSKRRIHYMKGKAGSGKTYLAEMMGRMRDKKGPIVVDCGGKDLSELMFETVLDFGKNKKFYDELNNRIEKYNATTDQAARDAIFHPHSINIFKAHLGEAFNQDQNGRIAIDWDKSNQCLKDDNGDYLSTRETVQIVNDGLMAIAKKEGFADVIGNALGMATQNGAIIRGIEEKREVVLDEFNRGKKGSSSSIHGVLQVIAGERSSVVYENTLKEKGDTTSQTYTVSRDQLPIGFFLSLTGNDSVDGNDVEELPESLNSRIIPQPVPIATQEDWQHFWCLIMAGIPISTHYYAQHEKWDENPDQFREKLAEWRKVGLPEGSTVPEFHLKRIENWEDTLEATAKLARFCHKWSEIVDPDSQLHRTGSLAHLLDEIDEEYKREVTIDFRKVSYFIGEAAKLRPKVIPSNESKGFTLKDDYNETPILPSRDNPEDPALKFGDRLVQVMFDYVSTTTAQKHKFGLYRQLMQLAIDCGMGTPNLHEGKLSSSRTVANLLNHTPYVSRVPSIQATVVRDLLCNQLREKDPKISANNDDIMSLDSVKRALDNVSKEDPEAAQQIQTLVTLNKDPNTILKSPLSRVRVWDPVSETAEQEAGAPKTSELMNKKALLFALTAPVMREKNLENLWAKAFTQSGLISEQVMKKNEPMAIAEGRSGSNLAVTTLMVQDDMGAAPNRGRKPKPKTKPLHLIWNEKSRNLLIIGEGAITPDLKEAFSQVGTVYIDTNDEKATVKTDQAIKALTDGNERFEGFLKTAFRMRAGLNNPEAENDNSLAELLTDKKVKPILPLYITNKPAAPAI